MPFQPSKFNCLIRMRWEQKCNRLIPIADIHSHRFCSRQFQDRLLASHTRMDLPDRRLSDPILWIVHTRYPANSSQYVFIMNGGLSSQENLAIIRVQLRCELTSISVSTTQVWCEVWYARPAPCLFVLTTDRYEAGTTVPFCDIHEYFYQVLSSRWNRQADLSGRSVGVWLAIPDD